MCSTGGGCDAKYFSRPAPVRAVAGHLLEETGSWFRAVRDLPPDYELPEGVRATVTAAYEATLAWVELLDRKAGTAAGRKP